MKTLSILSTVCIVVMILAIGSTAVIAETGQGAALSDNHTIPTAVPESAFEVEGTIDPSEQTFEDNTMPDTNRMVLECGSCCNLHGGLEGTLERTLYISTIDGSVAPDVEVAFTGTVNEKEGTFTAVEAEEDQELAEDMATFTTVFKITEGTGDLDGIQGIIEITEILEDGDVVKTYQGTLWFEE